MTKKRKSDATRLDEVDRSMYSTFCNAANSLSQLYTQAMHQQKLSFQAGERHSLEKLNNWILRDQENGVRVTTGHVLAYIQSEIDYGTDEPLHQQHHHSQTSTQFPHSGNPISSNVLSPTTAVQGLRSGNYVFSNALSSPVRRNLPSYDLSQGGYSMNNALRTSNGEPNQFRDTNHPLGSNDGSMDMHTDIPGHFSHY